MKELLKYPTRERFTMLGPMEPRYFIDGVESWPRAGEEPKETDTPPPREPAPPPAVPDR